MGDNDNAALTLTRRAEVREWLRVPRGRYSVERTSQLSGVPRSTVYDWNKNGILVADFDALSPKQWSYRDLVFLRLTAWLRARGMPRPTVAERVRLIRRRLVEDDEGVVSVRSDGRSVLINDESLDAVTGAQLLAGMWQYIEEFDLTEPVDELGRRRLWGPNLVTPSRHTLISPWVMGGDPCVTGTRVPTSTLFALRQDRGLTTDAIVKLYDGVTSAEVDDAIMLETRLRTAA